MMNEIAVFGGGCFWCTEALYRELRGMISVMPGYAGGSTKDPTYEEVCSGKTGHAEVIKIEYNPVQISFRDLLTIFFAMHDPTTSNRQGNDVGTQYRSIILYTTDDQKTEAEAFIKELGEDVVTELKPLTEFYEAEKHHQNYYRQNTDQPYCQIVISPKLVKLQKDFERLLRKG